jgi:hypothetical protein
MNKVLELVRGGKREKSMPNQLLEEINEKSYGAIHEFFNFGIAWTIYNIAQGLTIDQILKLAPKAEDFYNRLLEDLYNKH